MFFRPDERPRPRTDKPVEGLRVTLPNNTQYWFPGPEPLARLLAQQACPPELLNHIGTTVETGERCGTLFVLHKHLSGPVLSQVTKEQRDAIPTLIHPT